MKRAKTQHGSTVHFGKGYTVEVMSDYREWTDYASRILIWNDALVAALREIVTDPALIDNVHRWHDWYDKASAALAAIDKTEA